MKKRLEHEELLTEVLGESAEARATTLRHGLVALRRTRARRRITRPAAAALLVLFLAAAWVAQTRRDVLRPIAQSSSIPVAPQAEVIEGTSIRVLSDEELLAFFKDRPVALLGQRGSQRLVLLDEVEP